MEINNIVQKQFFMNLILTANIICFLCNFTNSMYENESEILLK